MDRGSSVSMANAAEWTSNGLPSTHWNGASKSSSRFAGNPWRHGGKVKQLGMTTIFRRGFFATLSRSLAVTIGRRDDMKWGGTAAPLIFPTTTHGRASGQFFILEQQIFSRTAGATESTWAITKVDILHLNSI